MNARWREIFFKALEVDHTFALNVVTVCAVLHNVYITAGDILEHYRDILTAQVSAPNQCPSHLQDHDYFIL